MDSSISVCTHFTRVSACLACEVNTGFRERMMVVCRHGHIKLSVQLQGRIICFQTGLYVMHCTLYLLRTACIVVDAADNK